MAERFSHALTYRFGGDAGGWSITKYLRLPHTYNHKPHYNRPLVIIVRQVLAPINARPEIIVGAKLTGPVERRVQRTVDPTRHRMMDVYFKYRLRLHQKTKALMTCKAILESDRSKQIFMIVADLHSAGASPDEIASVLWESPYFISKYGKDARALSTEIHRITGKLEGAER